MIDPISLIGLLIGFVSLIFSIYTYLKAKHKEEIELSKLSGLKLRFQSITQNLRSIHENIELIIKRSKEQDTNTREIRYQTRLIRSTIVACLNILEAEEKRLRSWKYGQVKGEDVLVDIITPEQKEFKEGEDLTQL